MPEENFAELDLKFSEEEYVLMVQDVLGEEDKFRYERLVKIAEKALRSYVSGFCRNSRILRYRNADEEILADICYKLTRIFTTEFLFKKNFDEPNMHPDEFQRWMFTITRRMCIDKLREIVSKEIKRYGNIASVDELINELIDLSVIDEREQNNEINEILKRAIETVFKSRTNPHVILTWFAMCVTIIEYGVGRIEANRMISEKYSESNLYEMYVTLKDISERVSWITPSGEIDAKMIGDLRKRSEFGKSYGQTVYKEFFKEREALAAISGWETRVNNMIIKVMKYGTLDG